MREHDALGIGSRAGGVEQGSEIVVRGRYGDEISRPRSEDVVEISLYGAAPSPAFEASICTIPMANSEIDGPVSFRCLRSQNRIVVPLSLSSFLI